MWRTPALLTRRLWFLLRLKNPRIGQGEGLPQAGAVLVRAPCGGKSRDFSPPIRVHGGFWAEGGGSRGTAGRARVEVGGTALLARGVGSGLVPGCKALSGPQPSQRLGP